MDINLITNTIQPGSSPGEKNIPAIDSSAATKNTSAPVETTTAVQQPKSIPSMEQLAQAVKSLNKAMESMAQGLEFSVDEDSHRTVVKVVDRQTKDVIRQIPSEEALEIAKALERGQGSLLSTRA